MFNAAHTRRRRHHRHQITYDVCATAVGESKVNFKNYASTVGGVFSRSYYSEDDAAAEKKLAMQKEREAKAEAKRKEKEAKAEAKQKEKDVKAAVKAAAAKVRT